jgi:hypothetical protein
MFQPIGPNLLLSWTMAWKKENANMSFLNSLGFAQSFNIRLSRLAYVLSRLDLRPVGGSIVIFTAVYSTLTGKFGLGIEVNQIRKSAWFASVSYSTIASSLGIQEMDKWQF